MDNLKNQVEKILEKRFNTQIKSRQIEAVCEVLDDYNEWVNKRLAYLENKIQDLENKIRILKNRN